MQFRRPARDVERRDVAHLQETQARLDDFRRHDFASIRAGVHVTMAACLIAALANVHLKHGNGRSAERRVSAGGDCAFEGARRADTIQRGALSGGVRQRMSAVGQGYERHRIHQRATSGYPLPPTTYHLAYHLPPITYRLGYIDSLST